MIKFEKGQIYIGSDTDIIVKGAYRGMVRFIEGCSPAAIHNTKHLLMHNNPVYPTGSGYLPEKARSL